MRCANQRYFIPHPLNDLSLGFQAGLGPLSLLYLNASIFCCKESVKMIHRLGLLEDFALVTSHKGELLSHDSCYFVDFYLP